MTDKEEYVIRPESLSYERLRALKEGMACIIDDCNVDDIKLVGASLIFVDTKSGIRYDHKEKVTWFDESEYEDD